MKENIVIPIKMDRLKAWTRWVLEAATWMISLGLLGASAVVASFAALIWLLSGSDIVLTLGLVGGLVLGLAGVWQLLKRIERATARLCDEPRGS